MLGILVERDRVRNFAGQLPDFHLDPERCQTSHEFCVKIGDRSRRQRDYSLYAPVRLNNQLVMNEIELNLENPTLVGNGRSCQAEWSNVERDFPPVVNFRTERQSDFAYDLGPHVEGGIGVLPCFEG